MRKSFFSSLLGAICITVLALSGCSNPAGSDGTSSGSNIATLSDLSVTADGTELTLTFYRSVYSYSVNVANDITSVTVSATPLDSNASVTVSGGTSLAVGANTVVVTVTAENGTTQKTYTITVNRASATASSVATLSSLAVGSETISLESGTYAYSLSADIAADTTSLTVSAVTTDSLASVDVSGNVSLTSGENTITVTVTAEDTTTTQAYTVTFVKRGIVITTPSEGAEVSTETIDISGTYYGSAAPDTVTLSFGCATTVDVNTVSDSSSGSGTWSVSLSTSSISTSDYTKGSKSLCAEATWGSSTAAYFRSIDYQYDGAATGYSVSGTVSTSETIPTGYSLFVYVYNVNADDDDPPFAYISTTITDGMFPYSYTLEGLTAGTYELYAVVSETGSFEDVLYFADGGDVTVSDSDLTGCNLTLDLSSD